MSDSEALFYCILGGAGLVFFFLFFIHLIDGDRMGQNQHYNRSYRSYNRYRTGCDDWEDNDFDGFHDNDDGPWNEDKY